MIISLNAKFAGARTSDLYKSKEELPPLSSMGNVVTTEEELSGTKLGFKECG